MTRDSSFAFDVRILDERGSMRNEEEEGIIHWRWRWFDSYISTLWVSEGMVDGGKKYEEEKQVGVL